MADQFQADIAAVQNIDAVPRILEVICRTTGMGFAAVARATGERWIACAVRDEIKFGLEPGGELQVETTAGGEISSGESVVVDHVVQSPVYRGHPAPAVYGFQSYISIPVVLPDGKVFGTLCAIDTKPARVNTPETIGMFRLFAELIASHLAASGKLATATGKLAKVTEKLAANEAILNDERRTAELRDQFIAVLGHDLRNPVASIGAGARLLLKTPLDENAIEAVRHIQGSVQRMSALITNVLDFARGRLGGGITLERSSEPVEPLLSQVIGELRTSFPERVILSDFVINHPLKVDRIRVSQLLSNLLGNALKYGAEKSPIRIRATTDGRDFEMYVSNSGKQIDPGTMGRLFQPFVRGETRPQGLGLGLYISSEIARAHGGALTASSTPMETRFTFRMPLA